ncbi:peptidylprolyl isomerase [Acidithiobacillus thiooxidans]|uniref:peptidylprolyl isomerase n=1 Tax=Acidithiobacillus thiooxidans ATCC 19377 TaxID=637390 RepID=A0A543PZA3_ACITH|nr:peptidylprolyl isomerase [Acidithiobacillus thiooxidans]MDX5936492.1 peptidyl-prolyl cis-trans isomerase [Acidithiobacillus thiooxidans]TQN49407.1 putative parvulin-type peptidyl-prolyl cis-trans isomerase [Acidithiobacillus thiooxidans ATCC 19377]
MRFTQAGNCRTIKWLVPVIALCFSGNIFANPMAIVNGTKITRAEINQVNPEAAKDPILAEQTLQNLINRTLLLQQAKKEKLDQKASYVNGVKAAKENLLIELALKQYVTSHPITQEEIRQRYNTLKSEAPKKQYRTREIVVSQYHEARKILEDLKKGQSFTSLAAEYSTAPNAAIGGENGWQNGDQISAPILNLIKKIKLDMVAGPISVPTGYTIIQLLGERPTTITPLKNVAVSIKNELTNQRTQEYISTLRKNAKIQMMTKESIGRGIS